MIPAHNLEDIYKDAQACRMREQGGYVLGSGQTCARSSAR
jgi:hypothetical protein